MSETLDVKGMVGVVRSVVGGRDGVIGLHDPCFNGNEIAYVTECIRSGWVSYNGEYVKKFERALSDYIGVEHVIAVVNGTSALMMCLKLVGVEPNDEVLIPALTFVATANCVRHVGAVPHLVDVDMQTIGLDPVKLDRYLNRTTEIRDGCCFNKQTNRRISAVVPVHCFGHPVRLDALAEVCERYHLIMVEDAAQSLGSYYKQKHTGRWGKASSISFNGNKIITTGAGGVILTDDRALADQALHLTTTAKRPHDWEYFHDRVGYNLRMPALCAAVGCAQIEQFNQILQAKKVLANKYRSAFAGIEGVSFLEAPQDTAPNHWMNVVLLDPSHQPMRDRILEALIDAGLHSRPAWILMHQLPMFEDCPRSDLGVAEDLANRLICLPSGIRLAGGAGDE